MFAALCGALARAGSLLLPGGISGTQLGPARPGSHPHPLSPVSLGGVVILKRGLIFVDVVIGKKSTFVSEKKSGCCIIFVVYKNPLAPGAPSEIGDSQNTNLGCSATHC